jgi:hypothetical protein
MSGFLGTESTRRTRVAVAAVIGALAIVVAARDAPGQSSAPPEPDGYTHYWPGACVQAMSRSANFYWRAREDTAEYTLARDTLLDDVRRVARDCATRFGPSAATLTGHDLLPLAQVLLAAGDDAGAKQAVERRLAEAELKSTAPRAWTLAQIVDTHLDARPARVDAARGYLAQLDALKGADAAPGQVSAWYGLAGYYEHVADDAKMRAASEETIKAGKKLNEHDRSEFSYTLLSAYHLLAQAEADRTGEAAAPRAVLVRATADIGKLRGMAEAIASYDTTYSRYGTKGAGVVADLWIGTPGDTVHPMLGKLTVLNFGPSRWTVPAMRRLSREVGDSLDVALIYGTVGYFRGLGPLTMGAEVPQARKHFIDELKVTSSLAITETKYHHLPDGRRVSDPNANDRAYRTWLGGSVVVLDRQGIIRRIWGYWTNAHEPRIVATLKKYK